MYSRNQQDLHNYNPLMKNVYVEKEKQSRGDTHAPRIRTHQLTRIPVMFDEPPNSQPKFRWMTSNWYEGEPEPHHKEWHDNLRYALGRMQGGI